MIFARISVPLVLTAALAACSGNLGGGQSTLPGAPQAGTNVQQIAPPVATPTPVSASNVATVGDDAGPQALPGVMGWGGSIAFAKPAAAPSASPNPKATAAAGNAAVAGSVSVGITAAVVEPSDAPHFFSTAAQRHVKHDPTAPTALFFISLLATSDLTLGEYPKIALDVPRDIAAKHRNDTFALALFDPEQNQKAYRLSVAERDLASPAPGSMPTPAATPVPTPTATATATPFGMPNGPTAFTPPPVGSSLGSGGLPPEYVAFKATAATLTLKADRPVVFALYAVPPSPSPSPSHSPASATSTGPAAAPVAGSSPTPMASAAPSTRPASSIGPTPSAQPS